MASPRSKAAAVPTTTGSSLLNVEALPPLKERKSNGAAANAFVATPRRSSTAGGRRPQTPSQENSQLAGFDTPHNDV
jgi:hypothetical protein